MMPEERDGRGLLRLILAGDRPGLWAYLRGHSSQVLLWLIMLGAAGGILAGAFGGPAWRSLDWVGDMFLNALKMLLAPLILAAVVSGVTGLGDLRRLGRFGPLAVLYYACTTGIAVLLGLLLVNLIQPGVGAGAASAMLPEGAAAIGEQGLSYIARQLVHPSLVDAAARNLMAPLILFSILLACALLAIGKESRPAVDAFQSLNKAMMQIVQWIMWLAPIGIFSLVAARLAEAGGQENILRELRGLLSYSLTVLLGLGIHFCLLSGLLLLIARRGADYLGKLMEALVTAFGTASSAATLPITIRCAEIAGVDQRSTRFILPLGATVNMDGTALYEAVAVMFIAQSYGIELGIGAQVVVFLTATLAAVGAAGIPQAGLTTMVIVLTAVGLPLEGIGLILAVDWLLDRFRTTVNVWGDAVGCAILARFLPRDPAPPK